MYTLWPFALRSIGNEDVRSYDDWYTWPVGYDRHNEQIGEKIHVSVLQRMCLKNLENGPYRPENLLCVLDRIATPIGLKLDGSLLYDLPIVGWDGEDIPGNVAEPFIACVKAALASR